MSGYEGFVEILTLLGLVYVLILVFYPKQAGLNQRKLKREIVAWGEGEDQRQTVNRTYTQFLFAGQSLEAGDSLVSNNGSFRLIQQTDGNLCLYEANQHRWCSQITRPGPVFTIMQKDANLVQYAGTGPANQGQWLWDGRRTARIVASAADFKTVRENPERPALYLRNDGALFIVFIVRNQMILFQQLFP